MEFSRREKLEWVAFPFSRGSSQPGLPHCRRILPTELSGKPGRSKNPLGPPGSMQLMRFPTVVGGNRYSPMCEPDAFSPKTLSGFLLVLVVSSHRNVDQYSVEDLRRIPTLQFLVFILCTHLFLVICLANPVTLARH